MFFTIVEIFKTFNVLKIFSNKYSTLISRGQNKKIDFKKYCFSSVFATLMRNFFDLLFNKSKTVKSSNIFSENFKYLQTWNYLTCLFYLLDCEFLFLNIYIFNVKIPHPLSLK